MIIRFDPEAELDVVELEAWYRTQGRGLVDAFRRSLEATLENVVRFPDGQPIVHAHFRRALIRRFPYAVLYAPEAGEIVVVAVYHTARDPRPFWGRRN